MSVVHAHFQFSINALPTCFNFSKSMVPVSVSESPSANSNSLPFNLDLLWTSFACGNLIASYTLSTSGNVEMEVFGCARRFARMYASYGIHNTSEPSNGLTLVQVYLHSLSSARTLMRCHRMCLRNFYSSSSVDLHRTLNSTRTASPINATRSRAQIGKPFSALMAHFVGD